MRSLQALHFPAVSFGKQPEQTFEVTFSLLYDDSIAGLDKFYKAEDSGGA